jgi:hypothetical protein
MSKFIHILLWIIFIIALILLISPIDILSGMEFDDWGYAIIDIILAWVLSRINTMKKILKEEKTKEKNDEENKTTINIEPKDE